MVRVNSIFARMPSDERGSVAIVFALLVTVLFGVLALAVDMARGQSLASKIGTALDAAALAGAKALDRGADDSEVKAAAKAYFDSQMVNMKIDKVTMTPFVATIDRSESTVSTAVDADMGTTFGAMLGANKITLAKSSSVAYKTRDVELAMALDVTGSMGDGSKLSDMRSAAKSVLDVLFADAKNDMSVRVAVVPWAASVNAGSLAASVSNGTSTDGCVVERKGTDAATDDYPSGADALPGVTAPYGYYTCSPNPVMPLRGKSQSNAIKSALDSFTPNGGTAGHIGTAWGWYLLSPSWAGLFATPNKPAAYSTSDTIKAVLLMSDGEFNLSYLNGASTDMTAMTDESYAQFQALCTGMKDKKVVVYMVGFGIPNARAVTEMQTCASGDKHFFQAVTGNELKDAFKQIATQLKSMRLTK